MKRILVFACTVLFASQVFAQGLAGKWFVYEGGDGAELVVTIDFGNSGMAELSHIRRFEAVSYGEGSQFWGTFHTTGGYFFLVKGSKSVEISVSLTDSTLVIQQRGMPTVSISAWLDEPYSTRDLSDYGDYKKQVVAQWKRDFPHNEDVKKGKWMMEHYLIDYYGDAFETLLEGEYRVIEHTDSALIVKKLGGALPEMTWRKISGA